MGLIGVYGHHEVRDCPLNNPEVGKRVIEFGNRDLSSVFPKYKIKNIVAQYHSGLEHTFLWVFDAEDPHLIEQFAVEQGLAGFNELKIVPLIEFKDVIASAKKIHGL